MSAHMRPHLGQILYLDRTPKLCHITALNGPLLVIGPRLRKKVQTYYTTLAYYITLVRRIDRQVSFNHFSLQYCYPAQFECGDSRHMCHISYLKKKNFKPINRQCNIKHIIVIVVVVVLYVEVCMVKVKDGIMSAIELQCIPECRTAGVVQSQSEEFARGFAAKRHQQTIRLQGTRVSVINIYQVCVVFKCY